MAQREDKLSLADAISQLVQLGLASHADQDRRKQRARELAGDTIDRMGDTTTTADDRAVRKRDLLDGPNEFERVRIDRAKRSKPSQQLASTKRPPTPGDCRAPKKEEEQ